MLLFVEIMAILCMIVIMFVGIWGFIIFAKINDQLKYKNYLLEKLTQHVYMIASNNTDINNNQSDNKLEKTNSK